MARARLPPARRAGRPGRAAAPARTDVDALEGARARPRRRCSRRRRAPRTRRAALRRRASTRIARRTTSTTSSSRRAAARSRRRARRVELALPISNTRPRGRRDALGRDRARATARAGLPDGHDRACASAARRARASARSSPPGVTLELEGEANDYVGKGLSGGRIIVYPPRGRALRRPRRTSSSATPCSTAPPRARRLRAASPASASRCATAARTRSSRASATTAAST